MEKKKDMEKKNEIKVNLYNGKDANAPFVKVEYLDKDAMEHAALMLIDSCSEVNVLFRNQMDCLCYKRVENEGKHAINGLGGDAQEVQDVETNFTLGALACRETFSICDVDYPQQSEYPIIGILGNEFMAEHSLALDYSDFSVHTSTRPADASMADCEYYFPMEPGYKYMHVPMVAIKMNGKQVMALADSGATDSMIAVQSLADSHVPFRYLGDGDTMVGLNGAVETKMGKIPFTLVSASEDREKELKKADQFKITSDYIWSQKDKPEDEKDQIPPIEVVLCSSFMASQGWVLDFGAQVIYKRKSSFLVDVSENAQTPQAHHLRFYADVTKTCMPLIQITEGAFRGMVLLIDSGSTSNVIFGQAYSEMRDKFRKIEATDSMMGLEGNPIEVDIVKTKVSICGRDYPMNFLVSSHNNTAQKLREDWGFPIAGLIGTKFMSEHDWTLDFGKQEIILPKVDLADLEKIRTKTA